MLRRVLEQHSKHGHIDCRKHVARIQLVLGAKHGGLHVDQLHGLMCVCASNVPRKWWSRTSERNAVSFSLCLRASFRECRKNLDRPDN